jgi:hypothetical protein
MNLLFGQKVFGQKVFGQKVFGQKVFGQKVFGQKVFGQKVFGQIFVLDCCAKFHAKIKRNLTFLDLIHRSKKAIRLNVLHTLDTHFSRTGTDS